MAEDSGMRHHIPFRSQYWDLENWQKLGFDSYEHALYWQNSSCGVLCLGMVLESKGVNKNTCELIKQGQSINAYTDKFGWSHDGLVALAKLNGITATRRDTLSIADIKAYIDSGKVLIISIRWAFESPSSWKDRLLSFWKKRGGHLALVTGYTENGFYVHHTSIRPDFNWRDRIIEIKTFKNGFTGRGIILEL